MPWYPSWIFIFWQLLPEVHEVVEATNVDNLNCMSRVYLLFYFHWKFNGKLDVKGNLNTNTGIKFWMEGGGEGRCWWVTGIGVAFEFFGIFFFNFLILLSNLIESLFMGNKTTVWGKICDQNPQRGNKASVQISVLQICPYPLSPSKCWYQCITNTTWNQQTCTCVWCWLYQ